jgi:leucyl aminopeptidase
VRNTAGAGYPIVAAAFLHRFVGDTPWAHIDIHSVAYIDGGATTSAAAPPVRACAS